MFACVYFCSLMATILTYLDFHVMELALSLVCFLVSHSPWEDV